MDVNLITLAASNGKDGIAMATNYKEDLELYYLNTDWEGNKLKVYGGKSLRDYPSDIAEKDMVFYIITDGHYRFTLEDQQQLIELVLGVVVRTNRKAEKALLFINMALKMLGKRPMTLEELEKWN